MNVLQRIHKFLTTNKGFTLIEMLIVITIIGILAATLVPNFIGFDKDARLSSTKSNLETLRSSILLYRAKEGVYPDALGDLLTDTYEDSGVEKTYLQNMPVEMISSAAGSNDVEDMLSTADPDERPEGWAYYTDTAEVHVNIDTALDSSWGDNEGQIPLSW